MTKVREKPQKSLEMKSTNTGSPDKQSFSSNKQSFSSNKVALILLEIGAVLFSRNRPFKFDSGILSPVYVDNRVLISYPKQRGFVVKQLIEKIKNGIGRV